MNSVNKIELICHNTIFSQMQEWLKCLTINDRRILLLIGSKGTGKTILSNEFLRQNGYEPMNINITDYNGPVLLGEYIYKITNYVGILDAFKTIKKNTKAIIFENIEAIYENASYMRELVKLLLSLLSCSLNMPIICNLTCNNDNFKKHIKNNTMLVLPLIYQNSNENILTLTSYIKSKLGISAKKSMIIDSIVTRFTGNFMELNKLIDDCIRNVKSGRITAKIIKNSYTQYLVEDTYDSTESIVQSLINMFILRDTCLYNLDGLISQLEHHNNHDKIELMYYKTFPQALITHYKKNKLPNDSKFWHMLHHYGKLNIKQILPPRL
jgi:SpoVK/Ycf46/Vps4 family AAA+-type ATPase